MLVLQLLTFSTVSNYYLSKRDWRQLPLKHQCNPQILRSILARIPLLIYVDSGFFASLDGEEGIVRFFDRSESYFTLHGKDAIYCAEEIYKTSTVLKYFGSSKLPYCTLSTATAIEAIKDLLINKGSKIQIWELDRSRQWSLAKEASPGNLRQVEEMLFVNSDLATSPMIAAIYIDAKGDRKSVGVAFTDASSGRTIGISQFPDNDSFANLEVFFCP
jgi:DNA mismatch repair protein MSH2